jgi:hypothetical protein
MNLILMTPQNKVKLFYYVNMYIILFIKMSFSINNFENNENHWLHCLKMIFCIPYSLDSFQIYPNSDNKKEKKSQKHQGQSVFQ